MSLAPYDALAALGGFRGRLLIIASEDDEVCSFDSIERFSQALPNAQFEKVKHVSHRGITQAPETFGLIDDFFVSN